MSLLASHFKNNIPSTESLALLDRVPAVLRKEIRNAVDGDKHFICFLPNNIKLDDLLNEHVNAANGETYSVRQVLDAAVSAAAEAGNFKLACAVLYVMDRAIWQDEKFTFQHYIAFIDELEKNLNGAWIAVQLLLRRVRLLILRNQFDTAIPYLQKIKSTVTPRIPNATEKKRLDAVVGQILGEVALSLCEYRSALSQFATSSSLFEQIEDFKGLSRDRMLEGTVHIRRGDMTRARDCFNQAIDILLQDDPHGTKRRVLFDLRPGMNISIGKAFTAAGYIIAKNMCCLGRSLLYAGNVTEAKKTLEACTNLLHVLCVEQNASQRGTNVVLLLAQVLYCLAICEAELQLEVLGREHLCVAALLFLTATKHAAVKLANSESKSSDCNCNPLLGLSFSLQGSDFRYQVSMIVSSTNSPAGALVQVAKQPEHSSHQSVANSNDMASTVQSMLNLSLFNNIEQHFSSDTMHPGANESSAGMLQSTQLAASSRQATNQQSAYHYSYTINSSVSSGIQSVIGWLHEISVQIGMDQSDADTKGWASNHEQQASIYVALNHLVDYEVGNAPSFIRVPTLTIRRMHHFSQGKSRYASLVFDLFGSDDDVTVSVLKRFVPFVGDDSISEDLNCCHDFHYRAINQQLCEAKPCAAAFKRAVRNLKPSALANHPEFSSFFVDYVQPSLLQTFTYDQGNGVVVSRYGQLEAFVNFYASSAARLFEFFQRFNECSGKPTNDLHPYMQAFSHFSLIHSQGSFVIADVQGFVSKERSLYMLTDPYFNHKGSPGIDEFWRHHTCNEICKNLGLHEVGKKVPFSQKIKRKVLNLAKAAARLVTVFRSRSLNTTSQSL